MEINMILGLEMLNEREKIILYSKKYNGEYEVIEVNDLMEGHNLFDEKLKEGNFSYLELGIDKLDSNGKYEIVRNESK